MKPELLLQAAKEYKELYLEEFDIELSDEQAIQEAQKLLQLFACLTKGECLQ